jgi:radical SAM protein
VATPVAADEGQTATGARLPSHFEDHPYLVIWETTRACDLVCKHCRACAVPQRDARELDTHEAKRLLDDVARMGTRIVVLTGGDPAKRPDLAEIVRHGTSAGLHMGLTPSATPLVTEELLLDLGDAGLGRLALSLDASHAEEHDAFRGVRGSFDRTIEILRTARRLGITTQVNTTVRRENLDDLGAIARTIAALDVVLWSVFVVVPTGRASRDDVPSAQRVEEALHALAEIAEWAPFDVKTTAAPHFRRVLLQRKSKERIVGLDGIARAPRGVNDGLGFLFVSHRGEVYPSGFLPIACGNVREKDIASIYRDHPFLRALRDADQLQGKCGVCEFRRVCGGSRARAFATTGDPFAEDPACAYVPKPLRS